LRRNFSFTAGSGTINIPNFVLPVGDIFPVDGGDLVCIFEDVTYVAIRPEWDRVTVMGGMGRGGVKSESARR